MDSSGQQGGSVELPGSARLPLPGSSAVGPLDPAERVEVTVVLRPRPGGSGLTPAPAVAGGHLSREELAAARGAALEDVAAVEDFARANGLEVAEVEPARRRVVLAGRAETIGAAFGVVLERFEHGAGSYRTHAGPVKLPAQLAPAVVAVLGLDDRPQAAPRMRPALQPGRSYTPPEVAAAYCFPERWSGAGQTIAFVELGGGYEQADLVSYFARLGLSLPPVEAVSVDGGENAPTKDPSGPDGEVMLDLEVAGSVANGANLVVYFAPNTDRGFVDALSSAVHDTAREPRVVSISWGGPEDSYTPQARAAFEEVLTDAALAGVSVCAAAGDGGSSDGVGDGLAHVDYPAASPQVLACGGTTLVAAGSQVVSEVVWNDQPADGATGGGVSAVFPLPAWQEDVGVPPSANPAGGSGRGVPDVAGDADPNTGYQVRVDGIDTVVGGTSAVAPLWSALLAIACEAAGRSLGFVNPALYGRYGRLPALSSGFHDITQGTNGAYEAKPGWDPCTGLGSPKGLALVASLTGKS